MARPKKQSEDDILKAAMERVQSEQGSGEEPTGSSRSKGKNSTVAAETPEPVAKSGKQAMVCYKPLEQGDPIFTIFFGMKFEANIPRATTNVELIKLARANPWFTVDGNPAPKRVIPTPARDDSLDARSGLPGGLDPSKHEVDAEDVI